MHQIKIIQISISTQPKLEKYFYGNQIPDKEYHFYLNFLDEALAIIIDKLSKQLRVWLKTNVKNAINIKKFQYIISCHKYFQKCWQLFYYYYLLQAQYISEHFQAVTSKIKNKNSTSIMIHPITGKM